MDWPTAAVIITTILGLSGPVVAAFATRNKHPDGTMKKLIETLHQLTEVNREEIDVCERLAVVESEVRGLVKVVERIESHMFDKR